MDTVTIDLTPEMKARLAEIAEKRRRPVPESARELLAEAMKIQPGTGTLTMSGGKPEIRVTDPERAARVRAARGSMAYLGHHVDDFLRERHEEALHEEEQDRQRREGMAR